MSMSGSTLGSTGKPHATHTPRITVITATFNSSKTLKLTLQSLLAQDFTDFEAWIVGDACTDDSESVVASFGDPRLHWTNLAKNDGSQGGPNNEGLRHARGDYVAYLGHDDLWFPWHLSGLLAHIESQQADLVHALSAVIRPGGLAYVVGPPGRHNTYLHHFVFPSCWLHRREAIAEIGGWPNHRAIYRGVDSEVMHRLAVAGKKIAYCEQLSLLKFPSYSWGIYAWQGVPPQEEYLQRLLAAPEAFKQQCLLDIATLCARNATMEKHTGPMIKEILLHWRQKLYTFYGKERFPLRQYLVWKFQRRRRAGRKTRGLDQ